MIPHVSRSKVFHDHHVLAGNLVVVIVFIWELCIYAEIMFDKFDN